MFDPVAYINEPRWRKTSLGLSRTALLMEKLGNPQRDFAVIHVAGTNGKGSTCAYLDAMLRSDGRKTGLFTSPYIERFEERIRVDGEDISPADLLEATLAVREAAEAVEAETGEHPTEFELMFAVGCVHFSRSGCDAAVIEVGLGGALDATNVVEPALAVITAIGLDHTDILGDTLEEIAGEKTGIVKPGVPVVSYPQAPEAASVVRRRCEELGCPLTVSDFSALDIGTIDRTGRRLFTYKGVAYETGMLALYQPENAAVAIDGAAAFGVSGPPIRAGVAAARWPGRFEVLGRAPLFVVDGSHNPQGAWALRKSLEELLGDSGASATFVMGVLADKDYPAMVEAVLPLAERFVVYTPDNPRALEARALASEIARQDETADVTVALSAADAVRAALEKKGPEGVVAAFGTLYAIGDIKRAYESALDDGL